jgi:dimethylglycine dehydrogenase
VVDRMICGRLPRLGRVVLSWMLNDAGGIVSEFTVTRLAEDRCYLCSAASAEAHDLDIVARLLPVDGSVRVEDVSGRFGTLVLAGPRSRDVLATVTRADLSTAAFPWMAAREIELGFGRTWALRVGYLGELGYELHAPMEQLAHLYDLLMHSGAAHGIGDFGVYAMDSLRLEKGYRAWKADLVSDASPVAAGLERLVDWSKPDFIGRTALVREHNSGPQQRLVTLVLDDAGEGDALPASPVWSNGEIVGLTTSGGYGHRVGQSIALAYVHRDHAGMGQPLAVEILGERRSARVTADPLYDPTNVRMRA